MKKKIIFLVLVLMFVITGCSNKKSEKLVTKNIEDYYIDFYSKILEQEYRSSYSTYLYDNPQGNIDSFKKQYVAEKQTYAFKDVNNDNINEFIIISGSSNQNSESEKAKEIKIFTINTDTKEITKYLYGNYWDNLYYNKNNNTYVSKYNDSYTYDIMTPGSDGVYYMKYNLYQNKTGNIFMIKADGDTLFKRDELLNGNISKDEALKYISDLVEINFELKDANEIITKNLDDSILQSIEKTTKRSDDSNLKCSSKDVDNIIKILQDGYTVSINRNDEIIINKIEGTQFYDSVYPYFTQYTISCGSYSKTIRIPHK